MAGLPKERAPAHTGWARTALAIVVFAFYSTGQGSAVQTKPTYTFVVGVPGSGHDAIAALARMVVPAAAKTVGKDVAVVAAPYTESEDWFTETSLPLHNVSEIMRRITSVYGAEKDLIFASNRFPARNAIFRGFGWASHADILTLSRLPVNVRFVFLKRLLSAAMKSERDPKVSAFPWMARLDTNAIVLETYYNGPVCQPDPSVGGAGSRCKVLSVDLLDTACLSPDALTVPSPGIKSALDVLSWATGVPLETPASHHSLAAHGAPGGQPLCSYLQMEPAARRKTLDPTQKRHAEQMFVPSVSASSKEHGTQERNFFAERSCLYPHVAPCADHAKFSTPPEQPRNASTRYVFVAGIEGAGHHLVGAIAKAIIWGWNATYSRMDKYNYKFRNYDPKIFLQFERYPLYSSFSLNKKIPEAWPGKSIFFQAESYPMGSDHFHRHPDLYTFSRVTSGKPVAIFVRRALGAATLSLLRRYGKSRVRVAKPREGGPTRKPINLNILQKELEVKETSAILVEHSYRQLCTGDTPMLECYDLTFEHICSAKASAEQQRAAFIAVACALGIPPDVAKGLDWAAFKSPCKVHGDAKPRKKGKRKKQRPDPPVTPPTAPPPGVAPPPRASPYDPLALKFVTDFARGRSSVAIHAATPDDL